MSKKRSGRSAIFRREPSSGDRCLTSAARAKHFHRSQAGESAENSAGERIHQHLNEEKITTERVSLPAARKRRASPGQRTIERWPASTENSGAAKVDNRKRARSDPPGRPRPAFRERAQESRLRAVLELDRLPAHHRCMPNGDQRTNDKGRQDKYVHKRNKTDRKRCDRTCIKRNYRLGFC